ncbi:hypothetical protein JB92DRAFT_2914791 [Gautieria morchelliformis]|nr:hypothetical protein JB92DRAFT_2914791 [Gautieria morchelliformis]
MDWEDCVVDVHSLKLPKTALETMFTKCGPVRSITHWKGQGEKPHIFFEYKAPGSADSARAVGLDRSDLQVIKISNNEMLKRKFRELAHGPLRERDQRCRLTGPSPRSIYAHFNRESSSSTATRNYDRPPAKPTGITPYVHDRDAWARYEDRAPYRNREETRDVYRLTSTSASVASSSSNSREYSRRDRAFTKDYDHSQTLPTSKSILLTPPTETPAGHKTGPTSEKSLSILNIPHAGEIIKFDLDTQLEDDPTGIIRILSAVKADQKLWMVTAAYYKGKHNLDSAKKILEAGIDMAAQVGEETDTKPFWHLLGQINSIIQARSSPRSSVINLIPITPSVSFASSSRPGANEGACIQLNAHEPPSHMKNVRHLPATPYEPTQVSLTESFERRGAQNPATVTPLERHPIPCIDGNGLPSQPWPTRSRKHEVYSIPQPPPSPNPPSVPMASPAQLYSLQNEIGALREKQNTVLDDLSHARAAKRRAEDEVKEERSVRRKLEKHLRATEDALARSKRMEDAALDQVKREVEARRRAEALLADLKSKKEQAEHSGFGPGQSLFTSNSHDSAVLFHLASMIRGVPSSDRIVMASGESGVSSARVGGDLAITGPSTS